MTDQRKAGNRVRSRRSATIAAAAAAAVIGTMPVQAAADSPSGLPTYQTEGSAVRGTASSTDAPTLKPGRYTDTIAPGETKYYGVDLDAKSGAFISAFGLPKPGTQVAYDDGLKVLLEAADGADCNSSSEPTFRDEGAARPIGDWQTRVIDPDRYCQEAGHYLFSVERISDGTSDPGPWPLEISYMLEPGLKKGTTPPAARPSASASPAQPTGEPRQVKGGTGFNDAPAVGTGVWKDRLLPGQTRFYRVPIDWGQQLFATTEFANAEQLTDDSGSSSEAFRVELFNTARGLVTSNTGSYDGEQTAVDLGSATAAYSHRLDDSANDATRAMRFSGWYYLAVSLHSETEQFIDGGVPFTLRLKVDGEPQPGPEYDGDAVKAGFGLTDDDREAAAEGAVPSAHGSGTGKTLLAFAAFGVGGALLLGLLAWLLIARRRSADAAPSGW